MITITQTPQKYTNNVYKIIGDNIDEIIDYCMPRIRKQSQDFYRKSLREDLEKKESLIDNHAGMGIFYNIILKE